MVLPGWPAVVSEAKLVVVREAAKVAGVFEFESIDELKR